VNLKPFSGRGFALCALFAAQLCLSWTASTLVTLPALAPLRRHPDGPFALYAEGGRVLLEVLSNARQTLTLAGATLGLVALAYGLFWMLFGAMIPVLAVVEPAPSLHRAAAYSLRRFPTLAGLAVMALAGYALAGAAGLFAWWQLSRQAERMVDVRAGDLLQLRAVVPALLLAALVSLWHDVARTWAVGSGRGVRASTLDALAVMVTAPRQIFVRAMGLGLLGALSVVLAYLASRVFGGRDGAALVVLTLVQQAALAWRFGCRARWLLDLGTLYRARATPTPEALEGGPSRSVTTA
jgi:hypothetical protein